MSIAVFVLVRPCVYVRAATLCLAALVLICAVLQASGVLGAFRLALPGAGVSCGAGLLLILLSLRNSKNLQGIDISGSGTIRLTVYQGMAAAPAAAVSVRLMPGSTLWPNLLLLRLVDASGHLSVLQIWSGSVARAEFRALALACRVIAARSMETT